VGSTVDVTGKTILPGLHDLHVHLRDPAGPWGFQSFTFPYLEQHLASLLRAGVTTVLDTGSDRRLIFALRERAVAKELLAPDVLAVGSMVTVSGGHPCYEGNPVGRVCVTVDSPAQVGELEAKLLSFAPDAVKVVLSPEELLPTLSPATLAAIVDSASARGLPTFAHVATADNAIAAADAGVRALAHIPMYDELSDADAARLAADGVAVVPTLAVEESQYVLSTGGDAYDDPALAADVPAEVLDALRAKVDAPDSSTKQEKQAQRRQRAIDNVRRAFDAGVTIATGSDAGIAGSLHGLSLHREIELYVEEVGMSPVEALAAATRNAAELLGLDDRGVLEAGALADLVVIGGDPTTDIRAIRNVERVFRRGVEVPRDELAIGGAASIHLIRRSALAANAGCVFPGECAEGLICDVPDARCVETCKFPSNASCGDGTACFPMEDFVGTDFCMPGHECDVLAQDCGNGAACGFVGNGATMCWVASSATHGQPCVAGACAPGNQCDPTSTCRQICDPASATCADATTCTDLSQFAGMDVGICQ
jgi:imidazolonepropionase-like amidohydrolase